MRRANSSGAGWTKPCGPNHSRLASHTHPAATAQQTARTMRPARTRTPADSASAVVLVFTVVVSCVLSAATYVLVEVPGRDLIRSLARGRIVVPRSLPRQADSSAGSASHSATVGSASLASAAGSTDSAS